ncbi:MAG: manganese efflux pump MntP family protein [archaeon]
MDTITILLIAIGLSMDAFAVSVTKGLTQKKAKIGYALRIALFFGIFQALMPVLGWWAGIGFAGFISGIDHWIAFTLLSIIGIRMIYESAKKEQANDDISTLTLSALLLLSIATSIDALAVGLSFAFLSIPVLAPALMFGSTTFMISYAGVYIGNGFGRMFKSKAELLGGLILIAIGMKILIEHTL